MKKTVLLFIVVIISPVLAGLYGILHDEITYTISPEYFTKFKFYQFGLAEEFGKSSTQPDPRVWVAMVGFMATWWTGVLIGMGNGLAGLFQADAKTMLKTTVNATLITIIVTILTGLSGYLYGRYYLAEKGVDWWLPDNLTDKKAFITVGSMHSFSYLGGGLGLIAGMTYQLITAHKTDPQYFKQLLATILSFGLRKRR